MHDVDKEVVFCYSCGDGWTNAQYKVCSECGEVKLKEDMYEDICSDCKEDLDEDEENED